MTAYDLAAVKQRLARRISVDPATGCWHWGGYTTQNGYGRTSFRGRDQAAHRVTYELYREAIPDGLQLDHLCHTTDADCLGGRGCVHRRCVNPWHLEPVTCRENVLRGKGFAAMHAQKTHCPAGHPYSGDNLYEIGDARGCRECWRIRARDRYHRLHGPDAPPGDKMCGECGAQAKRLRLGLCTACYSRKRKREQRTAQIGDVCDGA